MTLSRYWRSLVIVGLSLRMLPVLAQPSPIKFGSPDPELFTALPFAADSAAAVILCDYGVSAIDGTATGIQLNYDRVTRIKILKKAGFSWATVEIPLVGTGEKVVGLRGFTYNLVNGKVVKEKLTDDGQYTDDVVKHVRVRKFTMPNVREGSVIEYAYSLTSKYFTDLRPWQFQHEVPTRWSEYRVSYPDYFDYKNVLQGYLTPKVRQQEEGSTQVLGHAVRTWNYRWAMQQVPAFALEPFITTPRDYVSRIDFELSSVQTPYFTHKNFTWAAVDQALLDNDDFGMQLNRGGFLKDVLAKVPQASAGLSARVVAIHALVRDGVKYNDQMGIYTTAPLRRTFEELHRGSAADINLLLVAALRAAGIDANPVLLSTRDHGRINAMFPLASRFNYVVAHVAQPDGQDMLLDATDPLLPAGTLPERCLNQLGRLVLTNTEASRWVEVKPAQRRGHFQQVQLTLTPEGGLSGKVHEEFSGYAAAAERAVLRRLGEPKYRSQRVGKHSDWTVPRFAIGSRDEPNKALAVDYEFAQPNETATPGTYYLALLDDFDTAQSPFHAATRSFPVDFGMSQEETVLVTLTVPPGYELVELPKSAVVELPDNGGSYRYLVASTGDVLQLTSRLQLRKPVYEASEYAQLQEFYRLMLAKQAEKLIVKKKA